MSGSSPADDRRARRDRLLRLARGGDLAAASELHVLGTRAEDREALSAAVDALVAAGAWELDHGVHQLTEQPGGWHAQRQRFGCLPDAGLAVIVVGSSTETEAERQAATEEGQPDLAARAAEVALDVLLSTETLVAIGGDNPEARLCGLESRVMAAVHAATGVELTPRRAGRQRRNWLPTPHRRRRRAARRRIVRGQVAVAAVAFDGQTTALVTFGGCSLHRLRGDHRLERMLPALAEPNEPETAPADAPPAAVDATEASRVTETAFTRLAAHTPDDIYLLVGPDFDRVAAVLSARELLSGDQALDARARRLARTWARVASPTTRQRSTHEIGALLVRLVVTDS